MAKYKKGADGYFKTNVYDGTYNSDGSKHMKTLRSKKSSRDLERMVNEFKSDVAAGNYKILSSMTFLEYAMQWVKVFKSPREASTREMYERIINKYFKEFHDFPIQNIRRTHLQEIFSENKEHARTCQKIYITAKQIFSAAKADRIITQSDLDNLFAELTLPAYTAAERRTVSQEEQDALTQALFSAEERAFVYLLYGCGLRREEALALSPESFDFKKCVINITSAIGYYNGSPYVKSPKSKNSIRSIPMPAYTYRAVKDLIRIDPDASFIFHMKSGRSEKSVKGGPMTADCYKEFWNRIRNKINMAMGGDDTKHLCKDLTAHIFRHTYCTNLCYQIPTISIKKVAKLIGDSEQVVIKIYTHIMEEKENVDIAIENATKLSFGT